LQFFAFGKNGLFSKNVLNYNILASC